MRQLVHMNNHATILYCLTPATKGNLLVITRRHIERFEQLSQQEMVDIQKEIDLAAELFREVYGISDFLVLQKNGEKAGQSVAHFHIHLIPVKDPTEGVLERAFQVRERITDEEMQQRTAELRYYLQKRGL